MISLLKRKEGERCQEEMERVPPGEAARAREEAWAEGAEAGAGWVETSRAPVPVGNVFARVAGILYRIR